MCKTPSDSRLTHLRLFHIFTCSLIVSTINFTYNQAVTQIFSPIFHPPLLNRLLTSCKSSSSLPLKKKPPFLKKDKANLSLFTMYTNTPSSKFLVLLPHSPRAMNLPTGGEKAIVDGAASPPQSLYHQGRSESISMASNANPRNEIPPSILPGGFLRLGLDTK